MPRTRPGTDELVFAGAEQCANQAVEGLELDIASDTRRDLPRLIAQAVQRLGTIASDKIVQTLFHLLPTKRTFNPALALSGDRQVVEERPSRGADE